MKSNTKKVKALGLCSGGLDSMLSGVVLKNLGVHVEWITFETPFFSSAKARKASEMTGIPLTVRKITEIYLKMLRNPPCGYGKNMNPCKDCHALMFRLAGDTMKQKEFDFLFSGEVVGQRPMSQTKTSLRYVEKKSGYDGYILRPLSAKNLPVTIPEKNGLINREQLLDFSGRSRKPQIKLAKQLKINNYPSPGGGCLLTEEVFSKRLKDLFDHQTTQTEDQLYLLKYGRHYRLNDSSKLIIGRTKEDNDNIEKHINNATDTMIKVKDFPGPAVVTSDKLDGPSTVLASVITVGYSKAPNLQPVRVDITTPAGSTETEVMGLNPADFKHLMI